MSAGKRPSGKIAANERIDVAREGIGEAVAAAFCCPLSLDRSYSTAVVKRDWRDTFGFGDTAAEERLVQIAEGKGTLRTRREMVLPHCTVREGQRFPSASEWP